jgi:hypothetical protein
VSLYIEAGYDLADIGALAFNVIETGGASFSISLSSGKHFLRTSAAAATGDFAAKVTSYTDILTTLQTALNAGTGSGAYTVSFSTITEKVTIAHAGGTVTAFQILIVSNTGIIGFVANRSGALSYAGERSPDYWMKTAENGLTDNDGEYEGGDEVAYDVEAHDGTPSGTAKEDAPIYWDFVCPLEPVEKTGNFPHRLASASIRPWTWKQLFKHCRNVYPISVNNEEIPETVFARLRADGCKFEPRRVGDNYQAHYDIPLRTRVLARL